MSSNKSKEQRRWIVSSNSYTSNHLHYKNPLLIIWFSLMFPGYGHIVCNNFIWGMALITFEFIINSFASVNEAIFHSMIGNIEHAKAVLHPNWALLYIIVYIFTIWDSYWRAVDSNKVYQLAYPEEKKISPFKMSPVELNLLEKKKPWLAVIWSGILPGLGHYYLHRVQYFIFSMIWLIVVIFFSRIFEGLYYSMIGDIEMTKRIVDPQWVLFIPSLYIFSIVNSYIMANTNNQLFDMELSRFLKNEYQQGSLDSIYENGKV